MPPVNFTVGEKDPGPGKRNVKYTFLGTLFFPLAFLCLVGYPGWGLLLTSQHSGPESHASPLPFT